MELELGRILEPILQSDAELDKNQNWVPSPIDVLSVPVSKKLNWSWVWFFGTSSATGCRTE
jgi:hypothetical protein